MRKTIIVSTTAALVLGLASVNLVAQRQQGAGRSEGRERPGVEAGDTQRGPRRGGPDGAGPGLRGGRFGGGPLAFGMLPGALGLTAEQRTKVRDIAQDARTKSAPLAGDLRTAEVALRGALFAETRNDAAVRDAAAKVTELRQQIADIRLNASASIADMLTPEQRENVRAGVRRGPGDPRSDRGGPGRGGPGRRPAPPAGN